MLRFLIIPLLMLMGQVGTPTEPGHEEYKYEVRYLYGALNAKVAIATFGLKPDVWEEQEVYRTDILIKVQPIFRLFMNANYVVKGCFTRPGMKPLYYYTPDGKGEVWCRYTEGDEGVYYWRQLDKMPEPEIYTYPNDGRTMELMSLVYFARTYDFKEGEPCHLKMIMGGRPFPVTITLESTDEERYPGHKAQLLHVLFTERGLMENGAGNEAFIWREAEGSRPVLGMKVGLGKKRTMICNIIEE
jgi:hypothetical protein